MGQTALHCRAMNPGFDRARLALLLLLVALLGVGLWAYRGVGEFAARDPRHRPADPAQHPGRHAGAVDRGTAPRGGATGRRPRTARAIVRWRVPACGRGRAHRARASSRQRVASASPPSWSSTQGRILAASEVRAGTAQASPPISFAHLAPVLKGQSAFVRPAPGAGRRRSAAPGSPRRSVQADGKVVAVLALGSPVDKGLPRCSKSRRAGRAAAKRWPSMPRAGCCRPAAMPRTAPAQGLPPRWPARRRRRNTERGWRRRRWRGAAGMAKACCCSPIRTTSGAT
jgi:hypothetical protein